MMDFFSNIFGYVLNIIYEIVKNYGLAIILFSILLKLLLLPLTIKQQKTLKKSQKLQVKLKEIQDKYSNNPEKLNQEMMDLYAGFISDGYFEKHINRMRNYYHTQRDALLETIEKSPLSSKITISEEHSGLHFLMKIDTKISDKELINKAKEKGIKLSSLSQYYEGKNNVSHTFIINYSSIKKENMKEAIDRLYDCLL